LSIAAYVSEAADAFSQSVEKDAHPLEVVELSERKTLSSAPVLNSIKRGASSSSPPPLFS
jgi:hypothetical protein